MPAHVRHTLARWLRPYRLLKEPRIDSGLISLGYLVAAFGIGIPTILFVPDTRLPSEVDTWLAIATGVLVTLGGIMGAVSLFGGAWFLERAGIAFLVGGLLARAVIVSSLVFEPSVVVRLAEIVALSAFLAWRCRFVSGLTLNPARGRDRDR